MEETKRCPYCGEKILAVARKCKHCGEWLDKDEEKEKKACPVCGELVDSDKEVCPYCNEPTHFSDDDSGMVYQSPITSQEDITRPTPNVTPKLRNFKKIKENWVLRKFTGYAASFILVLAASACMVGFKQCLKDSTKKIAKSKSKTSTIDPFVKSIVEERTRTINALTKSPWHGTNSMSEYETENGWNIVIKGISDSKLTYISDEDYIEEGTCTFDMLCFQSDLRYGAEGKIKFREKGTYYVYSGSSLSEKSTYFTGDIISIQVKYNNTNIDDEDIIRRMRLILNETIKGLQNNNETSMFDIKTLTSSKLVLEEMEKDNSSKSSGATLTYTR